MMVEELVSLDDLEASRRLQEAVWGIPTEETVPVHVLVAARHAGGLVAGARHEGRLVGLAFGMASWLEGRPGHHSHMLGVLASHRQRGVGAALKWFQRDWCLRRAIPVVRWTFDPLQAGNAHFNLNKLGATASEYLVDVYGPLHGPLNQGIATDRLLVEWELASERAGAAAEGHPARQPPPGPLVTPLENGVPGGVVDRHDPVVEVAVPESLQRLLAHNPPAAARWRLLAREALLLYLGRGYRAEAFRRRPYPAIVLVRCPQPTGAASAPVLPRESV
ncbi:MAG: GNAT family N-acetyltransferase [Actinomycetota bacterium]|nr:GNAT family N-acetyltransferase [Actinomycetota bacterium]